MVIRGCVIGVDGARNAKQLRYMVLPPVSCPGSMEHLTPQSVDVFNRESVHRCGQARRTNQGISCRAGLGPGSRIDGQSKGGRSADESAVGLV